MCVRAVCRPFLFRLVEYFTKNIHKNEPVEANLLQQAFAFTCVPLKGYTIPKATCYLP